MPRLFEGSALYMPLRSPLPYTSPHFFMSRTGIIEPSAEVEPVFGIDRRSDRARKRTCSTCTTTICLNRVSSGGPGMTYEKLIQELDPSSIFRVSRTLVPSRGNRLDIELNRNQDAAWIKLHGPSLEEAFTRPARNPTAGFPRFRGPFPFFSERVSHVSISMLTVNRLEALVTVYLPSLMT